MQKIFFLTLYLLITTTYLVKGQDTIWYKHRDGTRTFELYYGENDPIPRRMTIFHLDLGFNQWLGDKPENYNLSFLGSRYVAISLHQRFRIGPDSSRWAIQAGLEAAWNNFMFEKDATIFKNSDSLSFTFYNNGASLKRNKLTIVQLNLPVMLHWQSRKNNKDHWDFGLGGYVGYRVSSYTKVMYDDAQGDLQKRKSFNDFYINPFRTGALAVIGYKGYISLFAKYELNDLFQSGKGPKLNTFIVGLRFF